MGKQPERVKARRLGLARHPLNPPVLKAFPTARKSPDSVAFMS
jgi:hypothetical protein